MSPGTDVYAPQLLSHHRGAQKLYVAGGYAPPSQNEAIKVIDTGTSAVKTGIDLGRYTFGSETFRVPVRGMALDQSAAPAGNKLYVLLQPGSGAPFIRVVDAATDANATSQGTDIALPNDRPSNIVGASPLVVNPSNHKLYYVDRNGQVAVIDGPGRAVLRTIITTIGSGPHFIVVHEAANKVFVFGRNGAAAINSADDSVSAIESPGLAVSDGAYDSVGGRIYLLGTDQATGADTIVALNANGAVVLTKSLGSFGVVRALTLDEAGGTVFLGSPTPFNTNGLITALNATDLSEKTSYAQGSAEMVYDSGEGGRLFLLDYNFNAQHPTLRNQVGKLRLSDSLLSKITVGYAPSRAVINTRTDRLYVADQQAPEMIVLDGATHAVLARVPVSPAQSAAPGTLSEPAVRSIAVSEALDRVYLTRSVTDFSTGIRSLLVDICDGSSYALLRTLTIDDDSGSADVPIAIDDTRRRLYIGRAELLVYNLDDDSLVTSVAVPEGVNGITVNPVTGRVYVAGGTDLRKIQIIDGASYEIIGSVFAGSTPVSGVADKKRNKIYIPNVGPESLDNSFTVIDGAANTAETFMNTSQNNADSVSALAIDEVTNTLYIADGGNGAEVTGRLTIFDGNSGYAFLGQIELGALPSSLAFNPETRFLFATNFDDGTISVLQNDAAAEPALLGNISTRARVGSGDDVLIGGFIVTGPQGSSKRLMVRAIGPSLSGRGVQGALPNTKLTVVGSDGNTIAENDDWKREFDPANPGSPGPFSAERQATIQATEIPPDDDLESAIVLNVAPGAYTAVIAKATGAAGPGGVALVEVFDLEQDSSAQLGNIATRGTVGTDENVMIGGIIILGSQSSTVIVRAIGPSLQRGGVSNALQDPVLEVRDSNGEAVGINDDWKREFSSGNENPDRAKIEAAGIPPSDDRESAVILTLPPAAYTAVVSGRSRTTGVALVEVYKL